MAKRDEATVAVDAADVDDADADHVEREPTAAAELEPVFDGGGTYRRDGLGTWRYTVDGDPVPGARDLLLGELFHPDVNEDATLRVVPRHWVGLRPGHPLAWVTRFGELGTREPFLVPADEWEGHRDDVVGMLAPELHPTQLVGVEDVAGIAGISEVTVRAYVHRRQMPLPVTRVGSSPIWSRPVIEQWMRRRKRGRRGTAEVGTGSGFPTSEDDG